MSRDGEEHRNGANGVDRPYDIRRSAQGPERAGTGPEMSGDRARRGPAILVERAARRVRRIPASIAYCATVAAFATLLLGLMSLPRNSTAQNHSSQARVNASSRIAPLSESRVSAEDNGGFNIFIVLGPQTPEWHREAWARDLESRVKEELAREGFPNIGVSVGRDGSVFLAGTVFRPSDKWAVEKIVENTPGVVSVHFHPGLQKLYGRGYLGVEAGMSPYRAGARVLKVWPGSPAAMAGIRAGDIILRFGGREVNGPEKLHYIVASYLGGERVPVLIERGQSEKRLTVRLGETSPVVLD